MIRYRIKNWARFQHYKSRRPPWIKLHRTLLDDCIFLRLQTASRALAPLIWLLASESDDASVAGDHEELAFRLRIDKKEIDEGIKGLIASGYIERLHDASNALAARKQNLTTETETPFPAPVNPAPCEVDCHLQQVQGCNAQGDLFETSMHTVQNALDARTASHPPIPVHSPKTEEISHGKAIPASVQGKKKRPSNPKPKINAWGAWIDINRENGRKDPVPVGPDTQAGKQLAANIADISELKQIYRNYLDDRDPWLSKQGHPLRLLPGRVNKYANERYGIGIPGEEFMESEAEAIISGKAETPF